MKEVTYIFKSGTLKRKDDTLLFQDKDGEKVFIPVEHLREIYVFGEVDINKRLLEFLAKKEIIMSYFNYYGYYTGSFYPREHYNSGYMAVRQAKCYLDEHIRLGLAKSFVEGAGKNSLRLLKYYERRGADCGEEIEKMANMLKTLPDTNSIGETMACEGQLKKLYYHAFNDIISNKEFMFEKRTRRPPKDRINALISFANSMIYTAVLSDIYRTHLDPRIGFLHEANFRRFSLNLDVAEIFKPVIGDRTIISVINKNVLGQNDFDKKAGGIMLADKGRKKFLQSFEERMKKTIKHPQLKKQTSYRRLIRLELYKIEKHLMGEKEYQPFVLSW